MRSGRLWIARPSSGKPDSADALKQDRWHLHAKSDALEWPDWNIVWEPSEAKSVSVN